MSKQIKWLKRRRNSASNSRRGVTQRAKGSGMDHVERRFMMVELASIGAAVALVGLHHLVPNVVSFRIAGGVFCLLWATVFACPCIVMLRRGEVLFRGSDNRFLSRRHAPVRFWFYLGVEAGVTAVAICLGVLILLDKL